MRVKPHSLTCLQQVSSQWQICGRFYWFHFHPFVFSTRKDFCKNNFFLNGKEKKTLKNKKIKIKPECLQRFQDRLPMCTSWKFFSLHRVFKTWMSHQHLAIKILGTYIRHLLWNLSTQPTPIQFRSPRPGSTSMSLGCSVHRTQSPLLPTVLSILSPGVEGILLSNYGCQVPTSSSACLGQGPHGPCEMSPMGSGLWSSQCTC